MHICERDVGLLLLKKWNLFWLSVLLVFVLYCDRNTPTLRTTSDLMMNVHTCVTENTTYTMVYVRSLCQIQWWIYTHVLLLTQLTPCCMSDHYVRLNKERTYMCYCDHYLHHCVCEITMSDLMMNVHTCVTDNTTYTMLYVGSLCQN